MSTAPNLASGNLALIGREIREFVKGGCDVVFTGHAEQRMVERNVTRQDVFAVLNSGSAVRCELRQSWRATMTGTVEGRKLDVVVAVTRTADGLVVITVI